MGMWLSRRRRICCSVAFGFIAILGIGCAVTSQQRIANNWERAWLDDSHSDKALAWVEARNKVTLERLGADRRFHEYRRQAETILTDPDRLPEARAIGDMMYNYWQDTDHPLGIWRRTSQDAYFSGRPQWQTIIDLDALSAAESRRWIFAGANCQGVRCLISLSDNGKDAYEVREFDLHTGIFVDNGFSLPEDKSSTWWYDSDTLLVATAAGGGKVTESELPRTIRLWPAKCSSG